MFSNLVFLIITLLLISLVPSGYPAANFKYLTPFALGLGVYAILIALIYLFNFIFSGILQRHKNIVFVCVNLFLIGFLCLFQYYFQAYKFIGSYYLLPYCLFAFALYLLGIGIFHASSVSTRRVYHDNDVISSYTHASMQMRMILPFALPFLVITGFFDFLHWIPNARFQEWLNSDLGVWYGIGVMSLLALLTMIFMPAVIQSVWLCKPLPESELKDRLENLCEKARFQHGGMLTWTVMNDSLTAAIVGVVPRYRYVMFTNRLLRSVSPNAIEAILAHEIGHSYRKHLWIYPLIIFGMFLVASLYSYLIGDSISHYFAVQNELNPSGIWDVLDAFAIFAAYALIIWLYFRIVFGYFSRLFERQADLHVFHLGLNPEWMVEALDDIAVQSGNIHLLPSWHHYSIQQRIDFIRKAEQHPEIIAQHTRRVRLNVIAYLILASTLLFYLISKS